MNKNIGLSNLRINMIGHSMGGLIIRNSLQYLGELNKLLNTFMSLGTPHAGIMAKQTKIT